MLGLCYWVGVNENTVEHMPKFFLGVDLVVFFFELFSSNFKPPPTHKGSAVFLIIGRTLGWLVLLLYVPSQQLWSLRDGQFT